MRPTSPLRCYSSSFLPRSPPPPVLHRSPLVERLGKDVADEALEAADKAAVADNMDEAGGGISSSAAAEHAGAEVDCLVLPDALSSCGGAIEMQIPPTGGGQDGDGGDGGVGGEGGEGGVGGEFGAATTPSYSDTESEEEEEAPALWPGPDTIPYDSDTESEEDEEPPPPPPHPPKTPLPPELLTTLESPFPVKRLRF